MAGTAQQTANRVSSQSQQTELHDNGIAGDTSWNGRFSIDMLVLGGVFVEFSDEKNPTKY